MKAYAGYYNDVEKIKKSASGGAVSAVSEAFIKCGGIVYGAIYAADCYSARYARAEALEDLEQFKGSKYACVKKVIERKGKTYSVYSDIINELKNEKRVLFIGLGCDIAALKKLLQKEEINAGSIMTVELICDGVTNEQVHEKYIRELEKKYKSKVTQFRVRYKEEGWTPIYIWAKFESGEIHIRPFYPSDYGYAFLNYKKKACYDCSFKNDNHQGDLIAADYWGCVLGMEEYHPEGVSLLLACNDMGEQLIRLLQKEPFYLKEIDANTALSHNPRYYTPHAKNVKWDMVDDTIKTKTLHETVIACAGIKMPHRFVGLGKREIVLWGTGDCFRRLLSVVKDIYDVKYVVDSDKIKWGKEISSGVVCISPEELCEKRDVFVVVMIENTSFAFQVTNRLLDMGIYEFDYVHNWIYYAEEMCRGWK